MVPIPIIRDLQGNVITLPDLPKSTTKRWTPNRKAIVVRAVAGGLISLEEALVRYSLTENEFNFWKRGLKEDGITGLKITHFQKRRRGL